MSLETWLSLDLSTPTGTLALHQRSPSGLKRLVETDLGSDYTHSERLLDRLTELLRAQGTPLGSVHRFITSSGPGSFTGLRIAFSTLKAFCQAQARPLEIMSGSEARALAWAAAQGDLSFDEIHVITHSSLQKFVRARFKVRATLQLIDEALVEDLSPDTDDRVMFLLDDRTPASLVPQDEAVATAHFPLHARHLAESLERASSRKTLTKPEDWINASPHYFGGRF